jgi:transcription initiation factor TFIID subunit 11
VLVGQADTAGHRERLKEMERQRQLAIMNNLNVKQIERYEHFRRAGFKKAAMKRLVTSLTGSNASEQVAVGVMGVAKIFVGELVETARVVMVQWGDKGATRPEHIREAHRRLKRDGKIPNRRQKKRLLKR